MNDDRELRDSPVACPDCGQPVATRTNDAGVDVIARHFAGFGALCEQSGQPVNA